MKKLPDSVVIVGGGPSGLFAARRLKQLATQQKKDIHIIILEKEDVVGGKCHTFSDPDLPELKTEWGAALVAPNYGVVIDAIKEHHIAYEKTLPSADETIEFSQQLKHQRFFGKLSTATKIAKELNKFNHDYAIYQQAKQHKTDLPDDLKLSFTDYARSRNMINLPLFALPFVPGFGYGDLSRCPAYAVLEYFGRLTIPDIMLTDTIIKQPPLLSIRGGFQGLMEKIAEDFDVRTGVNITSIKRIPDGVFVNYKTKRGKKTQYADALILANSPHNWQDLGLDITDTEQQCVDHLTYYRYPVAVCRIKGLPAKHHFFPEGLREAGFGHLALITTRDNRQNPEEGRLCTIYVNLPAGDNDFRLDHEAISEELKTIAGVTGVEFLEEKTWEDYMSTLPWDLRLKLDKEQTETNTLYLGSYALGAFEDVVSVANKACDAINEQYRPQQAFVEDLSWKNVKRAGQFFTGDLYPALDSKGSEAHQMDRCVIV